MTSAAIDGSVYAAPANHPGLVTIDLDIQFVCHCFCFQCKITHIPLTSLTKIPDSFINFTAKYPHYTAGSVSLRLPGCPSQEK